MLIPASYQNILITWNVVYISPQVQTPKFDTVGNIFKILMGSPGKLIMYRVRIKYEMVRDLPVVAAAAAASNYVNCRLVSNVRS